MDLILINKLNLKDYPDLLKRLNDSKDRNEAEDILAEFEKSLDKMIANLEENIDPQVLLDELHKYNEVKDMAQAAIGTLANIKGVTINEVHQRFSHIID